MASPMSCSSTQEGETAPRVYIACVPRRFTRRILKLRAVPSGTVLNLLSKNVERFRGVLVLKAVLVSEPDRLT